MTDNNLEFLQKFIRDNPRIERIEAIFPTINGIYRGKWLPAADISKLATTGLRLPISTYALDSWGDDVEEGGLGIISGDPDGIGHPIIASLAPIPWSNTPAAQILMTMEMRDGKNTPCPYDPRQQLSNIVHQYSERGLRPVIALELEFYLIKQIEQNNPRALPFHNVSTGNLNDLDQMQVFEMVLNEIRDACNIQNVLADIMIAEAGMCQFEINFKHIDDPLRAADQAILFKRIVKHCAKMHGMDATFMAKPFGNDLGNGMHAHVSVLDENNNNIFDNGKKPGSPNSVLLYAVGGLVETMSQMQAIFAPNLNSYRRYQPGSFAPSHSNWGLDHRGAAVRLPEISGHSARLEHRICGADANPYLALGAILGAMLHGIDEKIDPGSEHSPNENAEPALHHDWTSSIDAFEKSAFAKSLFGHDFHRIYVILRRYEVEKLAKAVSDVELALYLHSA